MTELVKTAVEASMMKPTTANSHKSLPDLPDIPPIIVYTTTIILVLNVLLTIALVLSTHDFESFTSSGHGKTAYQRLDHEPTASEEDRESAYSSAVNTPNTAGFPHQGAESSQAYQRPFARNSDAANSDSDQVDDMHTKSSNEEEEQVIPPCTKASQRHMRLSGQYQQIGETVLYACAVVGSRVDGGLEWLADVMVRWTRDEGQGHELIIADSLEDYDEHFPI